MALFIVQMEQLLSSIPTCIDSALILSQYSVYTLKTQLESAKGEVGRPFPQEQEYADKTARLKELNILLNMDQKDREILDAEPDEGDIEPPQRSRGWVR